ncbi:uncharacterized protein BDV14DRAFT_201767 [Aspergillus stella-maris]|uniref:uncharacterized protein n=1 Tax=Aspergillus stella-maris TaxID=1810926 RepID=UPI003CCD63A9
MFNSEQLLALLALAPSALAATCSLALTTTRTQNPIVGGDNTLTCSAKLDYGDGNDPQVLEDQCNNVSSSRCYTSNLPNTICVHTNSNLEDGYMDYGDQHMDFNEDACSKDKWASISGDGITTTCTFEC